MLTALANQPQRLSLQLLKTSPATIKINLIKQSSLGVQIGLHEQGPPGPPGPPGPLPTGGGTGDMHTLIYDPRGFATDAFNLSNLTGSIDGGVFT